MALDYLSLIHILNNVNQLNEKDTVQRWCSQIK